MLRDGIVSAPLSGTSPSTIELTSLGKVRESGQDRYSIWQIANPSVTDVRVILANAANDYRIPVLARAGTRTFVRSDKATGAAAHQLLVDSIAVESGVSNETDYADFSELSGADCSFQGNPLYVAEQKGSLKISTVHGATVTEIPSVTTIETLATEQPGGTVWTLSDGVIRSYDAFGTPLQSIAAPGSGSIPTGVQHLAIEAYESIWLVRGSTLYRIRRTDGNTVHSVTYDEPIRELSVDPRRGRLWVLLNTTARILRGTDNPEYPILEAQSIGLSSPGRVIAYDAYWGETWIGTASSLTRYDSSGTPTQTLATLPILATDHLVADGAGGLWGANGSNVFHVDPAGAVDAQLQPFVGLGAAIVDVAADPADGSAWVASDTRIRNYSRQETLLQDIVPTLPDGVIRQFRMLDLFADRTPPWVKIVSPGEGAVVIAPRPTLEIEYADGGGSGLAHDTLELRLGASPLPADCVPTLEHATCTLSADLSAGEVTILTSIFDLAGNESRPAPRTFTVQSGAPPVVTLFQPVDGDYFNQPETIVSGSLNRPATLTVNGQTVTVNAALEFAHTVTLQEGLNTLSVVAVVSSGARSERELHVTLDTIPPAPLIPSLISVTIDSFGRLRVTGQSGSVEPDSLVRIRNAVTGDEITVGAGSSGAFMAMIDGYIGDGLFVAIADTAGNEREETQIDNSGQTLQILVATPVNNATEERRQVIVSGTLIGPLDAGVAVNGVAAAVSGSGAVRSFFANVPLAAGENQLVITARRTAGAEVTRTIRVVRAGNPPFSVEAAPSDGTGPLDVAFTVMRHAHDRISRIEIDFDDDGVIDITQVTPRTKFTHRYEQPGVYRAHFRITTQPTQHYSIDVPIVVHATADVDAQIQAVWQLFTAALADGNSAAALQHMTAQAAQRYQSVFNQLQAQMPAIVASFSIAEPIALLQGTAEYIVRRPAAGAEQAFFIYFIRAPDGTWRVASM